MSKRNRTVTTNHSLDMKKLLKDAFAGKLGVEIPEHFKSAYAANPLTPASTEEKLEDELVNFFLHYLNAAIDEKTIAERYKTTVQEVIKTRDAWHVALARYYKA